MRTYGVCSSVLFLSVVLAGIYGVLHDQVTATISPEYFTLFKFPQFRIPPGTPFRAGVALTGFYATWWMGIIIGLPLALTGLLFPDHRSMRHYVYRSLVVVFCTAVLLGAAGYLYGCTYLTRHQPDWWFPQGLQDREHFIITGCIHNFSYLGGILGLAAGIIYLVIQKVRSGKKGHKQKAGLYTRPL